MLQLPADVPRDIGRSDRVGDLLLGKTFKSVPAFNLLSKIPPEPVIKETAYRIIVNGKFLLLNADFIVILAVRIVKPASLFVFMDFLSSWFDGIGIKDRRFKANQRVLLCISEQLDLQASR